MKVGINGAVRDISDLKVGVSGAVHAASELWAGLNGATKKVWPTISPVLDENTWGQISEASSSGVASQIWKVGDRKEIVLNGTVGALTFNDYHTYAFIIGFDHNAAVEGSNRIHFQLAKTALSGGTDICFTDSSYNSRGNSVAFRMNTRSTNSGGWEDSYMRKNICGTSKSTTSGRIMGAIPAELRNALKSVTKYTNNMGDNIGPNAVTATTDYFFLLSEYEVSGDITDSNNYEANYQQQYAYYSAGNSTVKYRHTSTSSTARWWLRSANRNNSNGFMNVHTDGRVTNYSANYSLGVAPGFCV